MTNERDPFEAVGDVAPKTLDNKSKDLGATVMLEAIQEDQMVPELSEARKATYVARNPDVTYGVFCSDDRPATEASAKLISEQYGVSGEQFLRGYGGATGIARRAAVTIAAQCGTEMLASFGNSFVEFEKEVVKRIEQTSKVKLAVHSAESNEDNASALSLESEKGLGCAYCAGVGPVTGLCQPASPLDSLAKEEQPKVFGTADYVDTISQANLTVEQQFFPEQKASFAIGRQEITDMELPVMILAGSHAKAADVEVVLNFNPTVVSQPKVANEAGVPFYNLDATAEAEMLMRAFPELHLQPGLLLAVIDHDARAVREALASSEGLHADAMKLTRNGSAAEAIAYLDSLQI